MKSKPLYKQIKNIPFLFLSIILINATFSLIYFFSSVHQTRILNVEVKKLNIRTYKSLSVGENNFVTGSDGKLYWKVKNYNEAALVFAANHSGTLNLYDQLYLLLLNILLFIMVHKIKEDAIFSNQVKRGLRLIISSVMLYPFISLLGYMLSGYCIEKLTGGQFTVQYKKSNITMFLFIAYLLIFMLPFIRKAVTLQEDQNLTI